MKIRTWGQERHGKRDMEEARNDDAHGRLGHARENAANHKASQ